MNLKKSIKKPLKQCGNESLAVDQIKFYPFLEYQEFFIVLVIYGIIF